MIKPSLLIFLICSGLIFLNEVETVTGTNLEKSLLLAKANKNNRFKEISKVKNFSYKTNDKKSSSKSLVGGWFSSTIFDGEKVDLIVFYQPDGTYFSIATIRDVHWFILGTGTWQFSDGTLYKKSEDGEEKESAIEFISDDEFHYQANEEDKWQRVSQNNNLSASQLLGTWNIFGTKRTDSGFASLSESVTLTQERIELKSDGTFQYARKKANLVYGSSLHDSFIDRTQLSGTWEYVNAGYADGFLILKDSQGQVISVSSIYWRSDGSFLHVNRNEYDKSNNQSTLGKIEIFEPI